MYFYFLSKFPSPSGLGSQDGSNAMPKNHINSTNVHETPGLVCPAVHAENTTVNKTKSLPLGAHSLIMDSNNNVHKISVRVVMIMSII